MAKNEKHMDLFEAIATRRSIHKFQTLEVPMEMIGMVLDAGRFAPSAGNVQNWRFVIIKDPDSKAAIAEGCLQQYWIAEAPIIIIVCGIQEKLKLYYGNKGGLYSTQNVAAAIQNMLLTVNALGLGSCWIGAFDDNVIKRTISIPENVDVHAVLPIGYPDEKIPAPMRLTLENVCFFESYGNRVINLDRVFQNPDIVGLIEKRVKGAMGIGKDISEKTKKTLAKKQSKK